MSELSSEESFVPALVLMQRKRKADHAGIGGGAAPHRTATRNPRYRLILREACCWQRWVSGVAPLGPIFAYP